MVDEDDLGQRWDYPFHFPERYGTSRGRFINSNPTGFLTYAYSRWGPRPGAVGTEHRADEKGCEVRPNLVPRA